MAQVVGAGKIKLNNGQVITPQQGGWYDAQQYWNGSLSNPGVINSQSNQQGAGQAVSQQVIAQTNPANVAYVQQQQQQAGMNPTGDNGGGSIPGMGGDGGAGNGAGIGYEPAPTIDLNSIYQNLYNQNGIADLEKGIADKTQRYNEAQSQINDNPFLSEASRVGRVQKLTTDFNNAIANDQHSLEMKKADIQTQVDIATKQFDINSQQAQQELQKFNMLLESGALAGANGTDIANITRATGISSGMIAAAIKANQAKNTQTSIIQYDDGTNQGFAVVNAQTGEIISKQAVAPSTPSKTGGGSGRATQADLNSKAVQLLSANANSYGDVSPEVWRKILEAYIQDGGTAAQFVANFAQYADTNRGDFTSAYGFANPQKKK